MGFELFASLGLDGTSFTRTLRRHESEATQFGKNVSNSFMGMGGALQSTLAGAFGVGALASFTMETVRHLSSVKDLSEQYNITTDEVQELEEVAQRSGLQFSNFGAVLDRINESRQQAVDGNKELIATYAQFGITLDNLQSKEIRDIDIMKRIGAVTEGVNMSSRERAELADLIGTRNQRVITTIQGLRELGDVFKVPEETISNIDKLDDKFRNLKKQARGVFADMMEGLPPNISGPVLQSILKRFFQNEAPTTPAEDTTIKLPGVFEAVAAGEAPAAQFAGELSKSELAKLELKQTELQLEREIAKLAFERLSPAEQERKLQEDINKLKADAAALQKSGDQAFANINLIQAAQKEGQLLALQRRAKEEPKTLTDGGFAPIITDALAKVGGFTGAGLGSDALIVEKEQRDLLRQIRDNTRTGSGGGYP